MFTKIEPANQWGWSEVLANKANYLLEVMVWQKSKDAQKKTPRNKPTPFVPAFLKKPAPPSPLNKDSVARPADDIKAILQQPRG